jgi:hypothetical protein
MRRDPVLRDVPVVIVTSADLHPHQRRQLGATAVVASKAQVSAAVLLAASQTAADLVGGAR